MRSSSEGFKSMSNSRKIASIAFTGAAATAATMMGAAPAFAAGSHYDIRKSGFTGPLYHGAVKAKNSGNTTLVDISKQMDKKTAMLACHASQREWLRAHHGMDEYMESMKRHAARRGKTAGVEFAEAFVQHRGHAYPANDLLAELLAS